MTTETTIQVLEREKRRNLSGTQHETSTPHKDYAPGWNEALASESEAHVKADRSSMNADQLAQASKPPPRDDELVKTTIEYVTRRHPKDGVDQSYLLKEEIEGPLGSNVTVKHKENMTASEESVKADRH